jgi:hypothetical protein
MQQRGYIQGASTKEKIMANEANPNAVTPNPPRQAQPAGAAAPSQTLTVEIDPAKGAVLSIVIKPVVGSQKDGKYSLDPPRNSSSGDPEPDRNSAAAVIIQVKGNPR